MWRPGYFAAAEIAARDPKVGIISIEVARPDFPVADRAKFADTDLKAAAKGFYVIRDFAPGKPKHGYIVTQGSSSTVNLVSILPRLEEAGINVKVVAAISEELFDRQPEAYRNSVLPPEARYDLMVVSTGTRRVWPLRDVGPADRRVFAHLRLGQSVAHRRSGTRGDRRSASGQGIDFRRHPALRERPLQAHHRATSFTESRPLGNQGSTAARGSPVFQKKRYLAHKTSPLGSRNSHRWMYSKVIHTTGAQRIQ